MKYNKTLFSLLLININLLADMSYSQGIRYFENEEYEKALPIITQEAQRDINKAAQYRLSEMHEKGLGTEVNLECHL